MLVSTKTGGRRLRPARHVPYKHPKSHLERIRSPQTTNDTKPLSRHTAKCQKLALLHCSIFLTPVYKPLRGCPIITIIISVSLSKVLVHSLSLQQNSVPSSAVTV